MPGQTWQCRAPGQPGAALEASGGEGSVAQPGPLPATGLGGPGGAPTLGCDISFGAVLPQGVPGSQLCAQTPELGPA